MPPEVTCPACRHRFSAPPGRAGVLACPRCGAALPRTEVRAAQRDIQARRSAPAALPTTVCPSCGNAVAVLCLICPHCEEPIAERHRVAGEDGGERHPFEKWLLPLATVGATVILLGTAGAIAILAAGGQGVIPAAVAFFVLVFILVVSFGAPLLVRVRNRSTESWGSLVLEGLAGLGCLVLSTVAAVVFLVAACAVGLALK